MFWKTTKRCKDEYVFKLKKNFLKALELSPDVNINRFFQIND